MGDPIQAAIEATQSAPDDAPPELVAIQVTLRTGRMVALGVPRDLQQSEALDLIGYIAKDLGKTLATGQGSQPAKPRIIPYRGTISPT